MSNYTNNVLGSDTSNTGYLPNCAGYSNTGIAGQARAVGLAQEDGPAAKRSNRTTSIDPIRLLWSAAVTACLASAPCKTDADHIRSENMDSDAQG